MKATTPDITEDRCENCFCLLSQDYKGKFIPCQNTRCINERREAQLDRIIVLLESIDTQLAGR